MSGVNRAILVGNLGADPEVRQVEGGKAMATFRIATSERFTNRDGEKEERTEWHRVVAWGKTAELAGEYLTKGRKVYVEGRLQTRKWTDRDGQERRTTEVVASQITFLGKGNAERPSAEAA